MSQSNKVFGVFKVCTPKHEGRDTRWFVAGNVVLYEDGTGKLRLNHIPDQEFHLFRKDSYSPDSTDRGKFNLPFHEIDGETEKK